MSELGLGLGLHKHRRGLGSPFVDSSLVLRLESDMGITLVGSDVQTREDQSPAGGNDVSAPTSVNRPEYLTKASFSTPSVITIFAVFNMTDAPSGAANSQFAMQQDSFIVKPEQFSTQRPRWQVFDSGFDTVEGGSRILKVIAVKRYTQ